MNLIRKKTSFYPSLVDDFLNQDWSLKTAQAITMPAVNIKEMETEFEIELGVPGKKKEDFEIEVENGVLSISSTSEEEHAKEKGKFTRLEFSYNSFRRTFTIPESVDPTKIDAKYTEGVLRVSLPKRKEALPQAKKLIKIR
ncbi:MAG: Hsp20/alpha crystallin family protein [Flavobacteriaceae bacterium]